MREISIFYTSVVFVLLSSAITMYITQNVNFSLMREIIPYYILLLFVIFNNSYQVATHILTSCKFLNIYNVYIPGGADDNQTTLQFTFHNQLDLWGWWSYFIINEECGLIYNALSSVHISTGILAILAPHIFQKFYIRQDRCPYTFQQLKIVFVLTDAIARISTLINTFKSI